MDRCYKCGKPGHKKSECFQNSNSAKCYNCGKPGHKKDECPGNSTGAGLKRCYDCDEMVASIELHRPSCTKSRHAKSALSSSAAAAAPAAPVAPINKKDHTDFYMLLDVSESMTGTKLDTAKECARDIVSRMNPLDRMAIVTFDSEAFFKLKPRPVEEIMRKNELPGILDRIFAKGATAIYDAIHLSISQLKDKNQRTVLAVLTDGEDNSSKHSFAEVEALLKEYPNISLSIIHIDGSANPCINYKNLCLENHGEYIVIEAHQIKVTVEHIFNTYYVQK